MHCIKILAQPKQNNHSDCFLGTLVILPWGCENIEIASVDCGTIGCLGSANNTVYDVSSYLDEHPGGDDVLLGATGKDATDEFEDAGHSKTARELMEQFFIGELDPTPPAIPEMEIVSKKQELEDLPKKILNFSKQYWIVPVAVVGLSVAIGLLYLRKK